VQPPASENNPNHANEIKELHIKAVVASGKNQQHNPALTSAEILRLKKEISREVTERVLKTLQQLNER
jgi:hypothetical protein